MTQNWYVAGTDIGNAGKVSKVNGASPDVDGNVNVSSEDTMERKRRHSGIRKNNKIGSLTKYTYPSGFTMANSELPLVFTDGYNYFTNFDVTKFKNVSSKTVYLHSHTGLDTNDGLTASTPVLTMGKALTIASDGDTISILDDEGSMLGRTEWPSDGVLPKSLNIIAKNRIIIAKANRSTWVKTAGYTNVYEFTRSSVIKVVDFNNLDFPVEYTNVTSIALVDTTPYSWYTDNVKLYVNSGTGVVPTEKIVGIMNTGYPTVANGLTQNCKIYLENIIFAGGDNVVKILGDATYYQHELYTKNCKFLYSRVSDCVMTHDCKRAYHQNSECGYSAKDGFNYSAPNSRYSPDFIEVNCKGYSCGDNVINSSVSDTFNGSTAHVNCRGIRINGTYYNNVGGNVVESATAKTVNIGCTAYDSLATTSANREGFGIQSTTAEMWVIGCISFGNDADMFCSDGSTIHIQTSQYDTTLGGGIWDRDTRL